MGTMKRLTSLMAGNGTRNRSYDGPMSIDKDLAAIEYEGWRLIELGRGAPDRIVPQYPTWTMRDLVIHVAEVHGRTGAICETLPSGTHRGPSAAG